MDNICRSLSEIFNIITPIMVIIGTFGTYVSLGNDLTPAKALSTLGYFNLMTVPLEMFSYTLFQLANVIVSLRRLQSFSDWQEVDASYNQASSDYPVGKLEIANGDFCWCTTEVMRDLECFKQLGDESKIDKTNDANKENKAIVNVNVNKNIDQNQNQNMRNVDDDLEKISDTSNSLDLNEALLQS